MAVNLMRIQTKFAHNLMNFRTTSYYINNPIQYRRNIFTMGMGQIQNRGLLHENPHPTVSIISKRTSLTKIDFKEIPSSGLVNKLWAVEQITSISSLFLLPAGFLSSNKELDMIMSATIILHSYFGMVSVIVDYLRETSFGKIGQILARVLTLVLTGVSLMGAYKLVYDDIGVANTIKRFWYLHKTVEKPVDVKKVKNKK